MKYNRNILVPYLTELYGIEVTCHTLSNKYNQYRDRVQKSENILAQKPEIERIQLSKPVMKQAKKDWETSGLFITGIIVWLISVPLIIYLDSIITLGSFIGLFVMAIGYKLIYAALDRKNRKKSSSQSEIARYNNAIQQYNESVQSLKRDKEIIADTERQYPVQVQRMEELSTELSACIDMRNKAYSIDIIPNQYRNLGSVAYLYEYFSSSKASDLDQIIQTMILADVNRRITNIENKLNHIISNQQAIYEKLTEIHSTAAAIYQQTVKMSNQMDNIDSSLEEQKKIMSKQSDELKMIRVNTDISNYLQMGTYLELARYR